MKGTKCGLPHMEIRPSLLAMERKTIQNLAPLNPKGSGARKSQTGSSALTYWSGIIHPCALVERGRPNGRPTRHVALVLIRGMVMSRFLGSLGASIFLNCLLIAASFDAKDLEKQGSTFYRVGDVLWTPAGAFGEALFPGHDITQIFLMILFSITFYTVLIWILMSLPSWWRHRQ